MKKIISIFIVLIGLAITAFVNYSNVRVGGPTYAYLPFPVQQTGCGDALAQMNSCTYSFIWWGIILSVIFWILVFVGAYFIGKKKVL